MPWFKKEGRLSKEDVLALAMQAADEAERRIKGNPKKVLLLPPDITRAHSGAGWITEALYKRFSKTADVMSSRPGHSTCRTPEQNKWMSDPPRGAHHAKRLARRLKLIGEVPASFVKENLGGKGRLADTVALTTTAARRAAGTWSSNRPHRPARSPRLRQQQQELLHRTRRQADDLRPPHDGQP
jgi:hypothetical protein